MIKAKKKFGQNFLKNQIVLETIIQSMPNDDLTIVEIGPGLGDLTKKLLEHNKCVIAFEIDDELCNILKDKFFFYLREKKLSLECTDVLKYWNKEHLVEEQYNLVANLPYYIATKIVLKLLRDENCKNILAMLQKEVANKFCAKCGEKDYSALSVLTEVLGNASIVCEVDPKSFEPPPEVFSAVLKIEKKRSLLDKKEMSEFESFLRVCFRFPRKTLYKNLSFFGKDRAKELFDTLHIDSNTRPHQLSSIKYLKIFKLLRKEDAKQANNK